jgi:hypothetical protein
MYPQGVHYQTLGVVRLLGKFHFCIRFKVLMAVPVKNTVFWDVTPCSLVEGYLMSQSNVLPLSS